MMWQTKPPLGGPREETPMTGQDRQALGRYLRAQRELAQLSLRALASATNVSDSYLSQVERGLFQPSPAVLRAIADGLGIAPTTLFRRMGWMPPETAERSLGVLDAIESDERLNRAQKAALISTYKAMVDGP
jgi:transcriptional regulator with XRE-family HTH domain